MIWQSKSRLSVMVDDTDDEAERKKKQEKGLAEPVRWAFWFKGSNPHFHSREAMPLDQGEK